MTVAIAAVARLLEASHAVPAPMLGEAIARALFVDGACGRVWWSGLVLAAAAAALLISVRAAPPAGSPGRRRARFR
jgi:hypothetical protein